MCVSGAFVGAYTELQSFLKSVGECTVSLLTDQRIGATVLSINLFGCVTSLFPSVERDRE